MTTYTKESRYVDREWDEARMMDVVLYRWRYRNWSFPYPWWRLMESLDRILDDELQRMAMGEWCEL